MPSGPSSVPNRASTDTGSVERSSLDRAAYICSRASKETGTLEGLAMTNLGLIDSTSHTRYDIDSNPANC